jgi:hypothetical protein
MEVSRARLSAMVSVLGLLAAPAAAQMIGSPVYFNQSGGVVTIDADYARGLNAASEKMNYFGGRATLGLSAVAITLGAGSAQPSAGSSTTSFGGDVALSIVRDSTIPVKLALQGGAAYSSDFLGSGAKGWHVPIGAVVTFNVKSPGASVEPWVAPRIDYTRASVSGGGLSSSGSRTKFAASAGLNVGLPSGLGLHVAVDYLRISGGSPFMVGAGLHYAIKVPSPAAGVK